MPCGSRNRRIITPWRAYNTRDNVNFGNHGKFMMNANATRFNFTIKGPELWGGKVVGFIEADFDGSVHH